MRSANGIDNLFPVVCLACLTNHDARERLWEGEAIETERLASSVLEQLARIVDNVVCQCILRSSLTSYNHGGWKSCCRITDQRGTRVRGNNMDTVFRSCIRVGEAIFQSSSYDSCARHSLVNIDAMDLCEKPDVDEIEPSNSGHGVRVATQTAVP